MKLTKKQCDHLRDEIDANNVLLAAHNLPLQTLPDDLEEIDFEKLRGAYLNRERNLVIAEEGAGEP